MRIKKIFLDNELTSQCGIEEINISRLNTVVAFVGKNGSGKTRILKLILNNSEKLLSPFRFIDNSISYPAKKFEEYIKYFNNYKEFLLSLEKLLEFQEKNKNNPKDDTLVQALNESRQNYSSLEKKYFTNTNKKNQITTKFSAFQAELNNLRNEYIFSIGHSDILQLKEALSEDPKKQFTSFEDLIESVADSLNFNVISTINKSSLAFFKKLPHQLVFDYFETLGNEKKYNRRVSFKRYKILKKFINDFLSKELTWESITSDKKLTNDGVQSLQSGIWKLDGREFNYNELSDGERTLFSYCLLFFLMELNPKLKVRDSIILIDEPELHLHPDSEIDLIQGLRKIISDRGQLIIATHSINILSALNLDEIFMVKKNKIYHPSRKIPVESLSELMSLDDRISKLQNLITSISEWSYISFMTQCFLEPEVIAHSSQEDKQFQAFKKTLQKIKKQETSLLLDFGAGKGRLFELFRNENELFRNFQYSALEPEKQYHSDLTNLGIKNIFSSHKELTDYSFDIIILCNVLHEIPIKDWVTVLNKIISAIKLDGFLIILEDRLLPKGEKIGEIGFIILDTGSIMDLFSLENPPISFVDKSNRDRILCTAISRSEIKVVKKESLLKSLTMLKGNTLDKLRELRKSNTQEQSLNLGRLSGFYSQQFINTKLAIDSISDSK
jgi:ABC-type cobalamin/Fe3+-siderophores transport system ATPase subunit/SAM-dependent methyltransferase